MARSAVSSIKSSLNKVNRAIERKKAKNAKLAEKNRLRKQLETKRKQLQKMK